MIGGVLRAGLTVTEITERCARVRQVHCLPFRISTHTFKETAVDKAQEGSRHRRELGVVRRFPNVSEVFFFRGRLGMTNVKTHTKHHIVHRRMVSSTIIMFTGTQITHRSVGALEEQKSAPEGLVRVLEHAPRQGLLRFRPQRRPELLDEGVPGRVFEQGGQSYLETSHLLFSQKYCHRMRYVDKMDNPQV